MNTEALGPQALRKSSQRGGQVYPCNSEGYRAGLSVIHIQPVGVASLRRARCLWAASQRPRFLSLAQMASAGREPGPAGLLLGIS